MGNDGKLSTTTKFVMALFVVVVIALYTFNNALQDDRYYATVKLNKLEEKIEQLSNQLYQLNVDLEDRVEHLEESILFVRRK